MMSEVDTSFHYGFGKNAYLQQTGTAAGVQAGGQEPTSVSGKVIAKSGELSRANQVGNGGYHNAITGGTEGDKFDRLDINLFKSTDKPSATNSVKENDGFSLGKIAQNLGTVKFGGKEISLLEGMEILNQMHDKQNNVREAGFQG